LESASSRADQIARQFLAFGMVPTISTLVEKIEAVTPDQVRALATRLFQDKVPAISAVGQLSHLSTHEKISGYFSSQ
jgi:predicted Zn-dependent peptidase